MRTEEILTAACEFRAARTEGGWSHEDITLAITSSDGFDAAQAHALEPIAGDDIEGACERLRLLAVATTTPVEMTFNGIVVRASPSSTLGELIEAWRQNLDAAQAIYRDSPEGIRQEAERVARAELARTETRECMESLRGYPKLTPNVVIRWIRDIAPHADHIESGYPAKEVAALLTGEGYIDNDKVGNPAVKDWTDHAAAGRWLIGQVINMANAGMSPHPMLAGWAEKWLETPPEGSI